MLNLLLNFKFLCKLFDCVLNLNYLNKNLEKVPSEVKNAVEPYNPLVILGV